ncbi:MAG: penicillin-binding protein [Pseudomonadota bacterium]|nr:penicillin-binding protein [Pseudomonadota bacterium]
MQQARIVYPAHGMILALDPDIPAAMQRVYLQAEAGRGLAFVINGVRLGSADHPLAWTPRPGQHRLQLVTGAGGVVREIGFQVRG